MAQRKDLIKNDTRPMHERRPHPSRQTTSQRRGIKIDSKGRPMHDKQGLPIAYNDDVNLPNKQNINSYNPDGSYNLATQQGQEAAGMVMQQPPAPNWKDKLWRGIEGRHLQFQSLSPLQQMIYMNNMKPFIETQFARANQTDAEIGKEWDPYLQHYRNEWHENVLPELQEKYNSGMGGGGTLGALNERMAQYRARYEKDLELQRANYINQQRQNRYNSLSDFLRPTMNTQVENVWQPPLPSAASEFFNNAAQGLGKAGALALLA